MLVLLSTALDFCVLDPSNISWFRGDSVGHFLAWHFFRREPWGVPPGQIDGLLAPLGTSIGSADALPLLGFPLKLFHAVLPSDFQYLGLWLFICYALQGVFGYLLARTFCRSRWLALLVGLFFLFSPIMIFRRWAYRALRPLDSPVCALALFRVG